MHWYEYRTSKKSKKWYWKRAFEIDEQWRFWRIKYKKELFSIRSKLLYTNSMEMKKKTQILMSRLVCLGRVKLEVCQIVM